MKLSDSTQPNTSSRYKTILLNYCNTGTPGRITILAEPLSSEHFSHQLIVDGMCRSSLAGSHMKELFLPHLENVLAKRRRNTP